MKWSEKTLFVVTGASRGIGKEIVAQFSDRVEKPSLFYLFGRNTEQLNEVADSVRAKKHEAFVFTPDFSVVDEKCIAIMDESIAHMKREQARTGVERFCFVHNHGTLDFLLCDEMDDVDTVRRYFDVNVVSSVFFNSRLLKVLVGGKENYSRATVIHITSGLAKFALAGCGQYCMTKAAKNQYFECLAMEYPELDVLNYSPGPVETQMQAQLREKMSCQSTRTKFEELRSKGQVLTTDQTVGRIVELLANGKYESGVKIDYYQK